MRSKIDITARGGPDNPSRMMDMAAMVSKAFFEFGGTNDRKLNVQNGCSSTAVIYSLVLSLGFGYLNFGNRFQASAPEEHIRNMCQIFAP